MKKGLIYVFVLSVIIIASIIIVSSINLDINHDGVINIKDLQILASHFEGKLAYNSSFDFNNDSRVDLFDVVAVSRQIGINKSNIGNSNTEPFFGNNTNDTLIWEENFSEYQNTTTMILAGGGPWDVSGSTAYQLDPTGGLNGTPAMTVTKAAGTSGAGAERLVSGLPSHFFAQYWFKLNTSMDEPADPHMKWLIIHNNAEGNSGCDGSPVARYEFPLTTDISIFGTSVPAARFTGRGVINGCDGPVASVSGQTAYFEVPGNPSWDSQMPVPVLSDDPDIGLTPWGAINDGNWHRITIEIQTGSPGYWKLWLDGYPYWDSSNSSMNVPGIPTSFMFETVSGTTSTAFQLWFDNIMVWKR